MTVYQSMQAGRQLAADPWFSLRVQSVALVILLLGALVAGFGGSALVQGVGVAGVFSLGFQAGRLQERGWWG